MEIPAIVCYSCVGTGSRQKREKVDGKSCRVVRLCKACNGSGSIMRKKRRDASGNLRKKMVEKSYPAFQAPGPEPRGDRGLEHLFCESDEELCFLAGRWKIFQKIDRHRYSTDDLVTSWVACNESKRLGYISPNMLDIGCGLGSVLMCNAWQLPTARCIGIEFQQDRYSSAQRSIEYNLGQYPLDQSRVQILNGDLRNSMELFEAELQGIREFDIITGTPPYFDPSQRAHPPCIESAGCLFELRGGVEEYCAAAARHLRRPRRDQSAAKDFTEVIEPAESQREIRNKSLNPTFINPDRVTSGMSDSGMSDSGMATDAIANEIVQGVYPHDAPPSVFVMCNTALSSTRVYRTCHTLGLEVVRRVDVVPRSGKPPLFCVFVIVLKASLPSASLQNPATMTAPEERDAVIESLPLSARVTGSLMGEVVEELCVRDNQLMHTDDYRQLLQDLGKPSSADREIFEVRSKVREAIGEAAVTTALCEITFATDATDTAVTSTQASSEALSSA